MSCSNRATLCHNGATPHRVGGRGSASLHRTGHRESRTIERDNLHMKEHMARVLAPPCLSNGKRDPPVGPGGLHHRDGDGRRWTLPA
jgi:hypothetical protein